MSIAINWPIGPFTLPPELLALEATDEHIFSRYDDGSSERRIFCNVPLLENELDQLEELTEHLCRLGIALRRRMESKRLRYLHAAAGSVRKVANMMMETESWRKSFFSKPIDDREIFNDLNLASPFGFVYISGRDKLLRPCLVVRVTEMLRHAVDQNTSLRCVCFLMEFIIRYMLLPGKCESTVTLLDLGNIGLMQFLPAVSRTRAIFGVLAEHYVGRSALTFVTSAPSALEKLISGLVPEEKRRKIVYVKDVDDIAK
ncbi:phosphoinositide binding protein, putative [Perkinsus marinus ATCC 50983]|uniref:Phosphoinositide binding protein, putative n=1 Tax=Perkinsus marinus (strain ATCC 50983 / TXsc) TaxID=423536 RepID=C5LQU1_PERM5|nr:phosphoinositide binding protein, putative [Perkinsus marinus ATCC 50983]EER00826.1 phosphoinositide binding protein, putative [Perkinsus marinus ATCC 50983]|eukprot:XP_002768108.1 phosphoinositide binding protein, putative [Perkinsus marinus ATCC 50983]